MADIGSFLGDVGCGAIGRAVVCEARLDREAPQSPREPRASINEAEHPEHCPRRHDES